MENGVSVNKAAGQSGDSSVSVGNMAEGAVETMADTGRSVGAVILAGTGLGSCVGGSRPGGKGSGSDGTESGGAEAAEQSLIGSVSLDNAAGGTAGVVDGCSLVCAAAVQSA